MAIQLQECFIQRKRVGFIEPGCSDFRKFPTHFYYIPSSRVTANNRPPTRPKISWVTSKKKITRKMFVTQTHIDLRPITFANVRSCAPHHEDVLVFWPTTSLCFRHVKNEWNGWVMCCIQRGFQWMDGVSRVTIFRKSYVAFKE